MYSLQIVYSLQLVLIFYNWTAVLEILAIPLSFKNNILKYNFLGLLVFHVSILWLTDSSSRDLGAITKTM